MEAQAVPRSGVAVGAGQSGTAWHHARGGGFEWVAPLPSSVVVAKLERMFSDIVQVPLHPLEVEEDRWGSQAILARCLSDIRAKALALGRPWVVYGQPIITAEWILEFVLVDSSIHFALLWIRLPQLPIEFWNDEILSSILAMAGQFLYSDDSTKKRKRGSFARACVQVDLSKPLRPGARIRGSRAPFWQQFSYENLEGICVDCGSVHLEGTCLAGPDSSSLSFGPGYGPWMAAIRRRKSTQDLPSGEQISASRSSPVQAEGWQVPKKLARRQSSRGITSLSHYVELKTQSEINQGEKWASCSPVKAVGECSEAVNEGMPMPVGTVAKFQTDAATLTEGASDSNPFACLGSDSGTARTTSREGGYTGPLKRTRPTELMSQRVVSRTTKAKGKAPLGGKASSQGSFSFQVSVESTRGSLDPTGPGKKKSHRKEGPGKRSDSGLSLLAQMEVSNHDSAVLLLKKAILRGEEVEAMDSSHLEDSIPWVEEADAMDSPHL